MITVVVPVFNEQDNISLLLHEIYQASQSLPISEIIYVDDNSNDGTLDILKSQAADYAALRIIHHYSNAGQSASLWTGVKAASNDIIVTLDGDGQNDPADIRQLFDVYEKHKHSPANFMVAGKRIRRNDSWIKRLSSRTANYIRFCILRDQTLDTGCSLKLFSRADYLNLPYFDHMHRFLPALMMRDGVSILQVRVSHRPRLTGISKYGTIDRLFAGIYDLLGVLWLQKRRRREFNSDEIYDPDIATDLKAIEHV